jgi:photosystem II stability/assembly factor-like uncharacterized protein
LPGRRGKFQWAGQAVRLKLVRKGFNFPRIGFLGFSSEGFVVTRRNFLPPRGLVAVLALAAGLVLSGLPALSYAEDDPRAGQIADLEKQIQDLHRKLNELKASTTTPPTPSPMDGTIPADWVKSFNWRCIGPANMGGRITALSIFEADPSTYWVATASGGLLKTINNGITFEHQFDHEATVSIGDVCVAPSDKNIVWIGTGENNPRNSVSYGDGVYKSTDGGKTWKNMGLKKSFQIGRIVVHPKNPNTVYVGALGRLYGPNEERGVFKTTDGGQTWNKVLYVDDKTGIIDLQMNLAEPETLLAATWERQRDEYDDFLGDPPPPDGIERYDPIRKFGKGSGIHKTTDGGKTWKKLTQGLPTCALGRIGLDYYRKDHKVVFAVIDTEKFGTGLPPVAVYFGVAGTEAAGNTKLTEVANNSPAAKAGLQVNDILVSVDGKPVPTRMALIDLLRPHKAGDKIKVVYQRGMDKTAEKKEVEVALTAKPGGGGPGGRFPNLGFFAEDAEGGAVVTEIIEDGPAAQAGLKVDDLITAIEGKPIERFFQALRGLMGTHKVGDNVALTISHGTEKKDISVPIQQGGFERMRGRTPKGHTQRPNGGGMGSQRENVQDEQGAEGFQTGGIFKSTDGGETWSRVNSVNPRPMYFSQVRVDPTDDKIVWVLGIGMYVSKDGGKTFGQAGNRGLHSDQHALWIDPHDGRHMIIGCDGGFYQSYDRAEHWDHLNHLALGQFYHVAVDPRPLYRAFGGLQDNGSWGGPTHVLRSTGPINEDWLLVGGGDGFVCRVDPTDPDLVYTESQGGAMQRRNLKTGERTSIRVLRTPGKPPHRFNWNTPFILSAHNPSIFYCGGEYVWRSVKRGDNLRIISPEITRTPHGSATALAESPKNPEVLWVGTDDGFLWITRDGGTKWTELSAKVGLPGPRWVATIEPSRYVEGRAYVAFDAHRSDDDEPYVYVTEDFGQTWKPLRSNLPTGSTRVCREDIQNQNLLYLGTEFGAWVSANRGASWTKLNNNLPTVAVHEIAQHPTAGEIVAATHGRSLWVLDVTPLRQMTADTLKAKVHLYEPNTVVRWHMEQGRDGWFSESARRFIGQNPPRDAQVYFSLAAKAEKVSLKVLDYAGKTIAELPVKGEPGLHRVAWNLAAGGRPRQAAREGGGGGRRGPRGPATAGQGPPAAGQPPMGPGGQRTPATGQPPMAPGGQRPASAPGSRPASPEVTEQEAAAEAITFFGPPPGQVNPGMYRLMLTVDGVELSQPMRVEPDPNQPGPIITSDGDEDDEVDP